MGNLFEITRQIQADINNIDIMTSSLIKTLDKHGLKLPNNFCKELNDSIVRVKNFSEVSPLYTTLTNDNPKSSDQ